MKHYIEMTLLASPEIPLHFLWQKVYQQLHLAFVGIKDENNQIQVGVSFPKYNFKRRYLGDKLRIFSPDKALLNDLNCPQKLERLNDYIHITRLRDVPDNIETYACFQRLQTKSSNQRIARRKAKRDSISFEEAFKKVAERKEIYSAAPFIQMESLSKGQKFPLIIQKHKKDSYQMGQFNTYGLSGITTVPEF